MHDIQDIMFAMEEEWNELENDAKQDFQSLRDEIKNKVMYQLYNMQLQKKCRENQEEPGLRLIIFLSDGHFLSAL